MKTNNHKQYLSLALSLAFGVALILTTQCGCALFETGGQPDPAKMSTIASLAAYDGAFLWLRDHPQDAQKFRAVRDQLDALLARELLTPPDFLLVLQALPIKELRGTSAALIIGNAVILYDLYAAQTINLDTDKYLRPVVKGVRDGLNRALPPP